MNARCWAVCTGLLCASLAASVQRLSPNEVRTVLTMSPLQPPPGDETNAVLRNTAAVSLGRALFFDQGLSRSRTVSCATCHQPSRAWADGQPVSRGLDRGRRNTPSLLNTAHHRWWLWDGSAATVWQQAVRPLEHDAEMGSSRRHVLEYISADSAYRRLYFKAFGHRISLDDDSRDREFANVGKALAAFVATIHGDCSRFDMFVAGLRERDDALQSSLSVPELQGLRLFIGKARCISCHNGPLFSDREFHDIRLPQLATSAGEDLGRYSGIDRLRGDEFGPQGRFSDAPEGSEAERIRSTLASSVTAGQFRTPSLRNVAVTAPYMHNGSFRSLRDVVDHYSDLSNANLLNHHEDGLLTPLGLSTEEREQLVAFMSSLTDVAYSRSRALQHFCGKTARGPVEEIRREGRGTRE